MPTTDRKLRVFLCHSSQDKPIVRELYQRLNAEGWIDPWLDEEKLLPGQDWDMEIERAVEAADAVIICFSKTSVNKEGYIQKEIRKVLDIALEKPEEAIFVIPLRLNNCELPRRLNKLHFANYFPAKRRDEVYKRLSQSLWRRHEQKKSLQVKRRVYKKINNLAGKANKSVSLKRMKIPVSEKRVAAPFSHLEPKIFGLEEKNKKTIVTQVKQKDVLDRYPEVKLKFNLKLLI